jgi:sRNA-binding regulator protein Hfq
MDLKVASQDMNPIETEKLTAYQKDGAKLTFMLITGGVIKGCISWIDGQSIGIENENGQNIILYKHSIAFIQEKA